MLKFIQSHFADLLKRKIEQKCISYHWNYLLLMDRIESDCIEKALRLWSGLWEVVKKRALPRQSLTVSLFIQFGVVLLREHLNITVPKRREARGAKTVRKKRKSELDQEIWRVGHCKHKGENYWETQRLNLSQRTRNWVNKINTKGEIEFCTWQ